MPAKSLAYVFLKLRYFGFRGKAQFVYLARPKGPGPRSPRVFKSQRSDRLFFANIQDIVNGRTFGPKIIVFSIPRPAAWARQK